MLIRQHSNKQKCKLLPAKCASSTKGHKQNKHEQWDCVRNPSKPLGWKHYKRQATEYEDKAGM